jgi:hypothetical protein
MSAPAELLAPPVTAAAAAAAGRRWGLAQCRPLQVREAEIEASLRYRRVHGSV